MVWVLRGGKRKEGREEGKRGMEEKGNWTEKQG